MTNSSSGAPVSRYPSGYLESYRDKIQELEKASSEAFDKVIVTLSGGALAITMTLVGQVLPKHSAPALIVVGWVLFTLALTLTLIALKTSQMAMRRQTDIIDKVARDGGALEDHTNTPNVVTAKLTNLSLVVFVAGVVLTVIYVAINAA